MAFQFKTTAIRSSNMKAIKSGNNASTERRLRAYMVQMGIRGWHLRPSGVPGCPDFIFSAKKIAVFVDGCFWHSCPRCGHMPKSNVKYWKAKLTRNKARDRAVNRELRSGGFTVIRFWECEMKRAPQKCITLIIRANSRTKPCT